ncbi:MAG TPA: hypothetical protein VN634_01855 [Candidatus Limnocylindrales bacterium]|nr:hypothetical protein [Candidatus Limnocylindrales bacterium]
MLITRTLSALLFALTLGLGVTACERHHDGPAERVGEKIDDAAHDVKDAAHDAKRDIKDAAHDAKEDLKH